MLSKDQIKILLQIVNETNFKGSDAGVIFEIQCKLQAMQYEENKEVEKNPS